MRASRPDHAAAVNAIYRTAAAPDLWNDTLNLLADHVGAIGGMLAYHSLSGRGNFFLSGRHRDDLAAVYLRHYVDNPYARALTRAPSGRVYVANQLVDAAAVRRSAFHADIWARDGRPWETAPCPH